MFPLDERNGVAGLPRILQHAEHTNGETAKILWPWPYSSQRRIYFWDHRIYFWDPLRWFVPAAGATHPRQMSAPLPTLAETLAHFLQAASRPTFPSKINSCSFLLKVILLGIFLKICWTSSGRLALIFSTCKPCKLPCLVTKVALFLRKSFWAMPKRCASANSATHQARWKRFNEWMNWDIQPASRSCG